MAGTSAWLTVPTRGDHPDLLAGIVADCGLPPQRIVVVATATGLDLPAGVHVRHDLGAVNIQRWWNEGIRCAERGGADRVLVVNDDIRLTRDTIPTMSAAMDRDRTDLCWATQHHQALTGWAWMLRLSSPVRPDETFRWWFGENDIGAQARLRGGATRVEAGVVHVHGNETTAASEELQALAELDREAFKAKWEGH